MAEASCSGSSPFKRILDHQTRDVSHHHDRFAERSPVNSHDSFRSTAQTSLKGRSSLDTFLAGADLPHSPAGRLVVHASALHPHDLIQTPAHAPPASDTNGWAADFARMMSNRQKLPSPAPIALSKPSPNERFPAVSWGPISTLPASRCGMRECFHAVPASQAIFDDRIAQWLANYGTHEGGSHSMIEVDAVMEQIALQLEKDEPLLSGVPGASIDAAHSDGPAISLTDLETPEVANLSLHDPNPSQMSTTSPPAAGQSAMGEAAERLLESIQHEDGEKWQRSTFLSLMRDFRDGRKDVVDNEIRPTVE